MKTISDKGQVNFGAFRSAFQFCMNASLIDTKVGLINNEGKNLKTKQSIRNIKKYIKSKSCSPTLHG